MKRVIQKNRDKSSSDYFVVPRGGSFNNNGTTNPVVRANGNNELTNYNINIGFRVVL